MGDTALCIQCGSFKRSFSEKCSRCQFEPKEPVDVAKSRLLGEPYAFAVGSEGDVVETGRSRKELTAISDQIKRGIPYDFPPEELAGVLQAYNEAQNTTPGQLILAVAKWIAPPLALAAAFLVLYLYRH